jgi:hypothetical protein
MGASYFILDAIPFPDETASGAPKALVEEAQRAGARRKYLARGEGGFFSFTAGDDGMTFVTIRGAASSTTLT